jgi:hypothetical protein
MRNWSPLVANAVVFALAVALEEWQKVLRYWQMMYYWVIQFVNGF